VRPYRLLVRLDQPGLGLPLDLQFPVRRYRPSALPVQPHLARRCFLWVRPLLVRPLDLQFPVRRYRPSGLPDPVLLRPPPDQSGLVLPQVLLHPVALLTLSSPPDQPGLVPPQVLSHPVVLLALLAREAREVQAARCRLDREDSPSYMGGEDCLHWLRQ
jgi:hypothetical protein